MRIPILSGKSNEPPNIIQYRTIYLMLFQQTVIMCVSEDVTYATYALYTEDDTSASCWRKHSNRTL